jgi:hypothetical protein
VYQQRPMLYKDARMQEGASLEITLASLPSSQEVHSTSSQTLSRQLATGFAVSNKPTTIRSLANELCSPMPCLPATK